MSEPETSSWQTTSYDFELSSNPGGTSGESTGMLAVAGGDATAIGTDTVATGSVGSTASVDTNMSEGYASASVTALASGSGDAPVYATATSYAEVYEGSDRSFSLSFNQAGGEESDAGSMAYYESVSEAYALDLEIMPDTADDDAQDPGPVFGGSLDPGDFELEESFTGNVAFAEAEASGYGEYTFSEVDLSAVVIEDMLSTVTITSMVEVG
ncbi:hypothetical protein [Teichococcus vastitatis]|uniref:MBG domain-containing protein n=1 Tax=Teichococcus vastitatis TaxID=2307076 RepID=A0ABS9W3J2_9PROT|nr:hypothetical protein [Pseudoroseomonas vastitatis]MCI0753861.1 hypothetical protein [Pseudoroseomonas vastitatis]